MKTFINKKTGDAYLATISDNAIVLYREGGGFLFRSTLAEFVEQYEERRSKPLMRAGTVTAEWFDVGTPPFPCFSDGIAWNGWGVPYFEKNVALQIIKLMPYSLELAEDGETINYINREDPTEEVVTFTATQHRIDNVDIALYAIGDGWTWDAVKFEESKS